MLLMDVLRTAREKYFYDNFSCIITVNTVLRSGHNREFFCCRRNFARYTGDRLRQVIQLPTVAKPVALCAAAVIEQLPIAGSYLQELATITAGGRCRHRAATIRI